MNYPINCKTLEDKFEFLYRAQELLRLEHNRQGRKFREGKISKKEWTQYLTKEFEEKSSMIIKEIEILKNECFKKNKWDNDIKIWLTKI